MLIYSLVAGVLFGLYFTLIGIGLNLIFGVMKLVNLAHGDFIVVGGFLACALFAAAGVSPLVTAGLLLVPMFIVGVVIYYGIVRKLRLSRDAEMLSLILFFGVSKIMEAVAGLVLGTSEQSIPSFALGAGPMTLFGQSFPKTWIYAAAVSAIAVIAVYVYLYKTRLGYPGLTPMPIKLIWNASASAPIGFYTIDFDGPFEVTDLVAVDAPEPLATFLSERGYLPKGVPLLKRVRAVSGQTVCRIGHVITVDGIIAGAALERDRIGRALPAWQGCQRIHTGEIFLMNWQVRDSLDGRYFGLISTDQIIGRAVPLWTDEDGDGRFQWRAPTH